MENASRFVPRYTFSHVGRPRIKGQKSRPPCRICQSVATSALTWPFLSVEQASTTSLYRSGFFPVFKRRQTRKKLHLTRIFEAKWDGSGGEASTQRKECANKIEQTHRERPKRSFCITRNTAVPHRRRKMSCFLRRCAGNPQTVAAPHETPRTSCPQSKTHTKGPREFDAGPSCEGIVFRSVSPNSYIEAFRRV